MIFQPPPPVSFSHPTDVNEPYPILQIGRHTYIRSGSAGSADIVPTGPTTTSSTDDFHTTLLTNQLRRPIHPLSRVHPSFRGPSTTTPPTRAKPPAHLSLLREVLFVLLICLSQVLMLAGISQALVPQVLIGSSFPDTTPGSLAWYSASYGLTAGTFVLPAGRLGDLFGHKKIFIIGFFWFGAWSLAAGFAEMVQMRAGGGGTVFFCLCRAMQGVGPAMLVPNGQAMLGRTYVPGKRKNVVMSLFGAAAPLGFVLGAVMSSLFAERVGWPWGFWAMAAVCGVLGAVSWGVIPGREERDHGRERENEGLWTRLDGYGMGLGVSGLVLFNFAFNQAPIVTWTTPYTYFILVIAVLLLAGFIYHELITPHPLVPIPAMRSQTNFVLGCTAAGWGCFSIWVYYALATLQNIRHWSPLLSSAAFAHAPVSGFVASMLTAYLMSRIKPYWIMFISMCAFFIGSVLLATAPTNQLYWLNTFFGILVMPFGMDMSNPAATIILSNSVPKEHQGIAASLVVTVVNYSISLALGLGGTLEVNVNDGGQNLEAGYRGAQWLSVGLGGLGVGLAAAFLARS
jgi:MFS family permease